MGSAAQAAAVWEAAVGAKAAAALEAKAVQGSAAAVWVVGAAVVLAVAETEVGPHSTESHYFDC